MLHFFLLARDLHLFFVLLTTKFNCRERILEKKENENNVIRLREQSDVLFFSLLLQKIFIVSSERSAFKLLLVEAF